MSSENGEDERNAMGRELDLEEAQAPARAGAGDDDSLDASPDDGPAPTVRATRAARARPPSPKTRSTTSKAPPAPKGKGAKASAPAPATPRAKRASVAPAAKRNSVVPPTRKSGAPRSRRAPTRGDEASIPPIASDLDGEGKTIAATEAASIPPPAASAAPTPADHDALAPVFVVGPRVSPFWKAAIGMAAVVCLVVGARSLARRGAHPAATASPPPPMEVAAAEPTLEPAPTPAEPASADPAASTAAAAETKRASLEALKAGKLDESIVAGEQATTLDPSDADSWLILGAAYQNKGNVVAAHRCYRECTKRATRGEVRECTFLLP